MILRSLFSVLLLSALVSGAFQTGVAAQDPAKTKGEPLTIETKATTPAPIPDFVAAYGLSFSSTHSLGQRLTDARKMSDPDVLAMIGTEMAIDEEVSGKKASLKAADIMSEAKDLAKMRSKEKELAAVALLLKDKAAAQELADMVGPAREAEAKIVAKIKSGERRLGFSSCTLSTRQNITCRFASTASTSAGSSRSMSGNTSFLRIITTNTCFT